MSQCLTMVEGDTYRCGECGMELKVIKSSRDVKIPAEDAQCHPSNDLCSFYCCGRPLERKQTAV
jgi:hypothetical protein